MKEFAYLCRINIYKLCGGGFNISIENNIKEVLNTLPSNVTLLGVSKTKPVTDIMEAYKSGVKCFGENKVQELLGKIEVLPNDIQWHFIGKLQTNKVKAIIGKTNLIHSLSSIKLLKKIEEESEKQNITTNVLMQINIGREESKSGIVLEELEDLIKEVEKCNFVKVKGIMVIIPKGTDESNRSYFKETKKIFENLKEENFKNVSMEVLSMGMSNDYKIAIEEGSNLVRVGSKIFGSR